MVIRILIAVFLFSTVALGQGISSRADVRPTPVLVELFTAEGCPTCPNAESSLAFLKREQPVPGVEIVTLAFHVDYFDRFGWKDRFASPEFTKRQELYAKRFKIGEVYTPQMIVDGRAEFAGTETGLATNAVLAAAKEPKGRIDLTLDGDVLSLSIIDLPKHKDSAVYLAVTEDGLETEVASSANRGRKLRHSSVVREFREIGRIRKRDARFDGAARLPRIGEKPQRYVVFVQESLGSAVLAVGMIESAVRIR